MESGLLLSRPWLILDAPPLRWVYLFFGEGADLRRDQITQNPTIQPRVIPAVRLRLDPFE